MGAFSKLRQWANRDDGRFYRIGNEPVGALTVVGTLVLIGALILWQLSPQFGISGIWVTAAGVVGLALLLMGQTPSDNCDGT